VTIDCVPAGDAVCIVYTDDGVGIPLREKEMIFQKGYGKGTGLGLFLSREILSITGISIAETGNPGEGARFEITISRGAYRFHPKDAP
jgi:signal transduction histidine kinase